MLHPDRFFDSDPGVRRVARELYDNVKDLPLVCPHGHVDPRLLAYDEPFDEPTSLFLLPDHYILRMLYSAGVSMEDLGVQPSDDAHFETDPRAVWQRFGDNYYLFRGTPTRAWLDYELHEVLGIDRRLTGQTAMGIYDEIAERLKTPAFRPRALFHRFNIEVLTTTDGAADSLEHHRAIRESGWGGRVLPCFRPDSVFKISAGGWVAARQMLEAAVGYDVDSYATFINALEERRAFFKQNGATSTDHGVGSARTHRMSDAEAAKLFEKALRQTATNDDEADFEAHMLMEMARMSVEDGLVMQIHPGVYRNHNESIHSRFGPDRGGDIPVRAEYTRNLHALLNAFGCDPRFRLIVFTLDESTYARELAPLAGHDPALRIGPAWWFFDSIEGMKRHRECIIETAGFYNTAGFNDDTRAFLSIPARHDLARRVDANY
ncbi:MAG: glucuronate isomerase, partial [Rhodothermales bacterium]|nr:glucuronate isomerase [Rhodothermales bacterium]